MQKKVIIFLYFLFIFNFKIVVYADTLKNILKEYPFALLGREYGILNRDDFAINSCDAYPRPFSPDSISYPYWQCFSVKNATFDCDSMGYDYSEKSDMSVLAISLQKAGETHEYLTRRAIRTKDCRSFENDWERKTHNEKYVCMSGPLIGIEYSKNKKKLTAWIFDKFKTKKGCVSYFHGYCNLKYLRKQNCKE